MKELVVNLGERCRGVKKVGGLSGVSKRVNFLDNGPVIEEGWLVRCRRVGIRREDGSPLT